MEAYMIDYVCSSKGVLVLPFAPAVILALPFGKNLPLFGFAWATVLLIFIILAVTPCATDLNCTRVAKIPVTLNSPNLAIDTITSTGGGAAKRVTYTGASGYSAGIVRGTQITVTGATYAGFNGTFEVTGVTATTIEVRSSVVYATETSSPARISSYVNYDALRDQSKAFTKAILIYYLLFLFFAVWGRLFLCKTPGSKGYIGGAAAGLNKTYEIPNTFQPDTRAAEKDLAEAQQREVDNQAEIMKDARKQVEAAQAKARALVKGNTSSSAAGITKGPTSLLEGLLGNGGKKTESMM
jgi:hypothetical protein